MPALAQARPRRRVIRIGPADHGRAMSLDDFDKAEPAEGYLYELSQGVIEVSGIPEPDHGKQIHEIRNQLTAYLLVNPGVIDMIGGGGEAKMLIGPAQSERHPDLSVYLDPPPSGKDVWSSWVPQIVIEVVSARSAQRDYEVKPAEYLAFGVSEYWIVDSVKNQLVVLTRWRGQWQSKIIKPPTKHRTALLPKFALDVAKCLSAGRR